MKKTSPSSMLNKSSSESSFMVPLTSSKVKVTSAGQGQFQGRVNGKDENHSQLPQIIPVSKAAAADMHKSQSMPKMTSPSERLAPSIKAESVGGSCCALGSASSLLHANQNRPPPSAVNHQYKNNENDASGCGHITSRDVVLSITSRKSSQTSNPDVISIKREPWSAYSVLPGVSSRADSPAFRRPSTSSLTNHVTSVLSPINLNLELPLPDGGSLFSSPGASARGRKGTKRAFSSSTASSDLNDIISNIISGPSWALPPVGTLAPSHTASPTPAGLPHGAWGHTSARGSHVDGQKKMRSSFSSSYASVISIAMAQLEGGWQQPASGNNLAVGYMNDLEDEEDNFIFKQEMKMDDTATGAAQGQGQGGYVPDEDFAPGFPQALHDSLPPPPPYPDDFHAEEGEGEEETGEEGGHVTTCCWMGCHVIFSGLDELVQHIERSHVDQRRATDDFTCMWAACERQGKPFNARYKLLIHMRTHTGEKPNKCTFEGCTKRFARLENLRSHMRWHYGERPYKCAHCDKCFTNASDRAKHQKTHEHPKPYVCQVPGCIKRYTDPSSLRKHQKNHVIGKENISNHKKVKTSNDAGNTPSPASHSQSLDGIIHTTPLPRYDDRSSQPPPPYTCANAMRFGPGQHSSMQLTSPIGGTTVNYITPAPTRNEHHQHTGRRMGVSYTGPGPMVTYLNSRQMVAPSSNSVSPIGALQGTRMGVPVSSSYSQQQQQHQQQPEQQQHVNWSLASTIAASSSGSGVTSPLSSSSRGETSPALSGQGQGHSLAYMSPMPSLTPVSYDISDVHYSTVYPPAYSHHHPQHQQQQQQASSHNVMPVAGTNMQERLMVMMHPYQLHQQQHQQLMYQQHPPSTPGYTPYSLEETLRNLPVDSVRLPPAISNQMGGYV